MFDKQKSSLFNEKVADQEVISSLQREITKLKGELSMSKIIKSTDGKYYTGEFEEVTSEEVSNIIAQKQAQLSELEAIAPGTESSPAPAAPASDPTPEQPSTPAAPDTPAPAATNTPADQPAAPQATDESSPSDITLQ